MDKLPWVDTFLDVVKQEYQYPPPAYHLTEPSYADLYIIEKVATEVDTFDVLGLKRQTWLAYQQGQAHVIKCQSNFGSIILLTFNKNPLIPPWNTWWRAVRLLSPKKPVRVLIFAHPQQRLLPKAPAKIGPEHLNGGATMPCDPQSIVVYRKEEATRVLIHELFHSSCSDPYHKDTPDIETSTEAWTELLLCAMAAKGLYKPWSMNLKQQFQWALRQEATTTDSGQIQSKSDYGWRYLTGRLKFWRQLGLPVPYIKDKYQPITSLRFTVCEPKNV